MILGNFAIFFNLLSIMAFSGLLIIFTLTVMIKLRLSDLSQYHILSGRRLLWFIAFSPWVVSLLAATIAIVSDLKHSPFSQNYDLLHWHHAEEFMLTSWHGLSMMIAFGYAVFLLMQKIRQLILNARQIKWLNAFAEYDKKGFYQLDTDAVTAFTAGYLRPRCYITSKLRSQLTDEEYQIIQLHEQAHARRFDPAKKWFFQLLTAFFPKGISQQLNKSMSLIMEQCADSAIIQVISDRSLIAMTLLKVQRLAVKPLDNNLDGGAFCYYAFDNVETRIRYILNEPESKSFPFVLLFMTTVLTSIACALSADIFHRLIETAFIH